MADFRRKLIFEVQDGQLQRHRRDVEKYARDSERSTNRLIELWKRLGAAIAAAFSIAAISTFTRAVIRLNADLEATETRLGAILGSTREASRLMQQFIQLSRTMTFNTDEIARAAQNLLLVGIATEDLQGELMTLGEIASASGTSLEDMAETYGRNVARGYVTTNNVMTMIRRGIPIVEQLAETIGVTEQQIWSMLSAREVSDRHLQETFQRMTSEGGMFFEMMQKEQGTLNGIIDNLRGLREEMMRDTGAGIFASIRDDLGDLLSDLEELRDSGQLREWAERAGEGIRTLYQHLRTGIRFIRDYGPTIARVTAVIAAFRVGTIAASTAVGAYTTVMRTVVAVKGAYRAALYLAAAAKAVFTGNTTRATIAMTAFNTVIRANPVGLLVGLLTSAATAFMVFRRRADDAALGLEDIAKAARDAREEVELLSGAEMWSRQRGLPEEIEGGQRRVRSLLAQRRMVEGAPSEVDPALARVNTDLYVRELQEEEKRRKEQLLAIDKEILDENRKIALATATQFQISQELESSIEARLDAHRAERKALLDQTRELTDAENMRVEALDQLIEADEKLQEQREAGSTSRAAVDPEAYAKALEAVEAIRRAQQLAAQATEAQRDALREVFDAQDRIATLQQAAQTLGMDAVAEEIAAERERLEAAQNRLRVEKDWEETIARAAEHWQEFQRMQLQPLQQMRGSDVQLGLNLQNAQKAVQEYERALTRLNNELASGAISQEDYARQVEEANLKALVAVKQAFNELRNAGLLTDELQEKFEEFFESIRTDGKLIKETFIDLASTLQDLGGSIRSMTRLVDVFGDLNRQTRQFLDGLADMADGAGRFVQVWNNLETSKARGTAGGIMQLAVPGIGMVAGLASAISGLISSNKEQKREMERLSQSLRDAAREIRASIDDMWRAATIGEDVSRADISQAERSIRYLRSGMSFIGMEDALARIEGTGVDFLAGIGDTFREQVEGLKEQLKAQLRLGAITEQEIVRRAAELVFGSGEIDQALEDLAASLGQAGASVAGATRLFDQLVKAGVGVEDAWQEVGTFLQDNVQEIPDFISDWLAGLMQMDAGSDAFTEAVQDMLRASMEDGFDLEGMTPRAFNDLMDFLLGIPGRIDTDAVEEGATALERAFSRLRILQQFTDIDPQRGFQTFMRDMLAMGDELTPTLKAELSRLFSSVDLSTEDGAQALLDWIDRAGRGLAAGTLDLGSMAEDEFEAVLRVLQNLATGAADVFEGVADVFASGIDGAVQALNILTRYMGVDAATAMQKFVEMLRASGEEVPAEARALVRQASALDVTTAEGRQRLTEIIAAIGALMLGADDDERRLLEQIAQGFQQIVDMPTGGAGEDRTSRSVQYLRTITEFQGNEIVLILSAMEHWARRQLAQQEIMARSLVAMPAALSAAVAAAMQGSATYVDPSVIQHMNSSRTISVQIGDNTRPLRDPDDIDYLVDAIADELRRELTRAY